MQSAAAVELLPHAVMVNRSVYNKFTAAVIDPVEVSSVVPVMDVAVSGAKE